MVDFFFLLPHRDKRIFQPPHGGGYLSQVGTLCLEFVKLTQLTGENEYFHIVSEK